MVARIRPYLGRMRGAEAALAVPARRRRFWSFSHGLGDGACTRVHVAAYPAASTHVRVERMDPPIPLGSWCTATGSRDAIVGGFFIREEGTPLGELWTRGRRAQTVPFDDPWGATRSCVSIEGDRVTLGARDELPE